MALGWSGGSSALAESPLRARSDDAQDRPETRRSGVAAWLSALSLAGLGRTVGGRPDWERQATGATRSWLRLVDDGRQPASWAAASPLLRDEVGLLEWEAALRAVRAPLGRCLWRKLQSRSVVEGPSGDLRGPYVVIRFESVFEGRRWAIETISLVLGPNGGWRVAAYFIG